MSPWERMILNLYCHGSYPLRWLARRRAVAQGRVPVVVLFYHRIADDKANEWTLSNAMFERQIHWLRDRFEMVSLGEAHRRVRSGENRRPCVAVTFDDGYADNCRRAIPLLVEHGIPCTYFVTLHNVLNDRPFPHDVALGRPLRPNTIEQLRAMVADGIDVGTHTYTHADLARVTDRGQLRHEIVTCGEDLREILGCPVRFFAFPFGQHANLSGAAFEMAHEAGYDAVCSAYGGYNFPGGDAFHLQRIPGDEEMARLRNWTTIDPRKLNTPRFAYDLREDTTPVAEADVAVDDIAEPNEALTV